MEKKTYSDPGDITNLEFDMIKPMKIQQSIQFDKLSIIVGTNGVGKSLLLKMVWFMNTVTASIIKLKSSKILLSINEIAQFTLDNTFDNCDFEGSFKVFYKNGSLSVAFVNGKIVGVESDLENIDGMATPIFMSKSARTFDQIKMILTLQETLDQEKTLGLVKLYDIVYVEFLKKKLEKGYVVDDAFKSVLESFDLGKYDIQSFGIKNNSVYFTNSKNEEKEAITLSAGEQSIINMFLGSGA